MSPTNKNQPAPIDVPIDEELIGLDDVDIELDPSRARRFCDDFYLDDEEDDEGQQPNSGTA